jgi:hypothetical protein
LFELSVDKNISVADMYRRDWGVREAGWRWRRRFFVWEEELHMECCAALDFIILQDAIPDSWRWLSDPNTGNSVSRAYHLLTHIVSFAHNDVTWNTIAPLKVSLFAWRLLNNRLPTKDNLIRRGMTHLDSILCTSGCGVAETSNHLFLGCNFSHFLWYKILHWLSVYGPLSNGVGDHASQFCNAYVFRKEVRSSLQVVWLTCCWILWKERNNMIFTHKVSSVEMLFDKVRRISWW